ncbi:LysR family transcriptional regulator [Lactococcus piscium]|uniref:LysR family transcriptional regulator n=1 Tax=Pseudolactococcus piscium TaxID=1364 RepID=A0A2A5S621_9LACT|nr:LysR family transcriptional regulator [Lactococcus piscium]PCS08908.1 LysR family transcriptional regulator [Lactococcus piscium]
MNIHHLEIFFHVAKFSSISKASKYLLISQPAVSAQLKKLEQTYNVKLIEKAGRGIKLTQIGEHLYGLIFSFFDTALPEVDALLTQSTAIKVYGNYLMTQYIVPEVLANHQVTQNQDRMLIKSMPSSSALAKLEKNTCDLILISAMNAPLLPANLVVTKLFDDELVLISKAKSVADIASIIISESKKTSLDSVYETHHTFANLPVFTVESTQDAIANIRVNHNSATLVSARFLTYLSDEIICIATAIKSHFFAVHKQESPQKKMINTIISELKANQG